MKLLGMRKAAVGKPKLFIETFRIDDQRIFFPFSNRTAVIQRIVGITPKLALLGAAIRIDNSIVVIAAADEDKDALAIMILNKLHPIGKLELARSTGRHAI